MRALSRLVCGVVGHRPGSSTRWEEQVERYDETRDVPDMKRRSWSVRGAESAAVKVTAAGKGYSLPTETWISCVRCGLDLSRDQPTT